MPPSARSTLVPFAFVLSACHLGGGGSDVDHGSFDADVRFLGAHTPTIVLGEGSGPRVAVAPAWQGRVMTSTTGGAAESAPSFGWINYELIGSRKFVPHINPFGGEDRFWLGPEGGQYAIFFAKGDPFDLQHWQTPSLIDTEPYRVVSRSADEVSFRTEGRLANYSGTTFDLAIDRTVRALDRVTVAAALGVEDLGDLPVVAYESINTITNTGALPWTKETGLLSVWILGMFRHSDTTTVVVPVEPGDEVELGPVVNDAYFGPVPPDRLVVDDGVIFFKGDGQRRSKIGVGPRRAKSNLGSYDPARGLLTLVQYTLPEGARDYVNSMWEQQDEPYAGDVVNSYNDGPPAPGKAPLGPFYELESSSPAAALAPGERLTHEHRTIHVRGTAAELSDVAERVLGVTPPRIARVFGGIDS